jgi:protein SCO1/2
MLSITRSWGVTLALATTLLLSACDRLGGAPAGPSFAGINITGAEYARELNLPDTDGRMRSLADFKGKVLVVFFGYTQCPDVCPTTMVELADVVQKLGADGQRVQGIFVSVDPERDTPELLKAYVSNFNANFVALRGTPDQVKQAAREFKVYYNKVPGKTERSYTVDHTAASYLFDTQGRVRVFERYGSGAAVLTQDLKTLLAER